MESTHYLTENAHMIEVEIYETGQKTLVVPNSQIVNLKTMRGKSIIITAAEYETYGRSLELTSE